MIVVLSIAVLILAGIICYRAKQRQFQKYERLYDKYISLASECEYRARESLRQAKELSKQAEQGNRINDQELLLIGRFVKTANESIDKGRRYLSDASKVELKLKSMQSDFELK